MEDDIAFVTQSHGIDVKGGLPTMAAVRPEGEGAEWKEVRNRGRAKDK